MTFAMGGAPAPGSDRILVELFQILKDDAVQSAALNMQYAICTQYAIYRLPAGTQCFHSRTEEVNWRFLSLFLCTGYRVAIVSGKESYNFKVFTNLKYNLFGVNGYAKCNTAYLWPLNNNWVESWTPQHLHLNYCKSWGSAFSHLYPLGGVKIHDP